MSELFAKNTDVKITNPEEQRVKEILELLEVAQEAGNKDIPNADAAMLNAIKTAGEYASTVEKINARGTNPAAGPAYESLKTLTGGNEEAPTATSTGPKL